MCACVHVRCVSSRCLGTDPAVSSKLSKALPKISTVSMKSGSSSEQEERCLHASFSQKHRHHSKDDLEVPLSNQDLQSASLSWDNHLHTLFQEAEHVSFGFHSAQLLAVMPTFL